MSILGKKIPFFGSDHECDPHDGRLSDLDLFKRAEESARRVDINDISLEERLTESKANSANAHIWTRSVSDD